MKVIVYADFNCMSCYLASQRADRLTREGTAEVDWRAVEHLPRLPVTGYKPRPERLSRAARPGRTTWPKPRGSRCPAERRPAGPPAGDQQHQGGGGRPTPRRSPTIQDRLRRRLFEAIWARGRNLSSAYDVRRAVTACTGRPPRYPHLISPDLPIPLLHDPEPCGSCAGKAGRSRPDGGPLTTAGLPAGPALAEQWLAAFVPTG